jgi:hypothetical protein
MPLSGQSHEFDKGELDILLVEFRGIATGGRAVVGGNGGDVTGRELESVG